MSPTIRKRHVRYALRGGTWKHFGRRAKWGWAPQTGHRATPLSWPVAPETAATMRVAWPRRYGSPLARAWVTPIRSGIAAHVPVHEAEIAQPAGNVVLFHVAADGATVRAALDYDDRLALNPCAEEVDLYFKMQYRREGYDTPVVIPGGYVSKHPSLYRYAHSWRALRDSRAPSLDVLGRFGMNWAQRIRGQAITMLRAQDRFRFQGGARAVWWGEYMDEICEARVCLDLPGHGEFCYRLVEYLAVGACIVGPELFAEMPVPLETGVHLVRVPRSLDGLIDWCERLVEDESMRVSMRDRAADYFDRYLALDQLGAYYVDRLWRALGQV